MIRHHTDRSEAPPATADTITGHNSTNLGRREHIHSTGAPSHHAQSPSLLVPLTPPLPPPSPPAVTDNLPPHPTFPSFEIPDVSTFPTPNPVTQQGPYSHQPLQNPTADAASSSLTSRLQVYRQNNLTVSTYLALGTKILEEISVSLPPRSFSSSTSPSPPPPTKHLPSNYYTTTKKVVTKPGATTRRSSRSSSEEEEGRLVTVFLAGLNDDDIRARFQGYLDEKKKKGGGGDRGRYYTWANIRAAHERNLREKEERLRSRRKRKVERMNKGRIVGKK